MRSLPRWSRRTLVLLAGVMSALLAGTLTAAPAMAGSGDDGEALGDTLSLGYAVAVYVGIPLAIIALIWFLASIPELVGGPRYRPGVSWWAESAWFGGPEASQSSQLSQSSQSSQSSEDPDLGGTSARW